MDCERDGCMCGWEGCHGDRETGQPSVDSDRGHLPHCFYTELLTIYTIVFFLNGHRVWLFGILRTVGKNPAIPLPPSQDNQPRITFRKNGSKLMMYQITIVWWTRCTFIQSINDSVALLIFFQLQQWSPSLRILWNVRWRVATFIITKDLHYQLNTSNAICEPEIQLIKTEQ